MAAPSTSGGGMSSAAPPSAAQVRLQAKRPRRCFNTEEDLAILREVAASKPFNDDLQWIHVCYYFTDPKSCIGSVAAAPMMDFYSPSYRPYKSMSFFHNPLFKARMG
ncbi:hypothetical protein HPB52_011154 [Rhipicephalus sanguineus]|uniref:Uncharacterized protein n=1 Tax=Rhipicephalus sanguineus TaxID=34632 RepID=A0A9D4SW84_RHISA|nr:hypothetical protein HPB52_011154 [Rhipicephalus sanguineus]